MGALDARDASVLDPKRRVLSTILLCGMAALGFRLFWLQVVRHEHFAKLSYSNQLQRERIPAPRGIIRARYGEKLVVNTPVYQISILPNRAARRRELLALACEWLKLDPKAVESELDSWMKRYTDGREMVVVQAANKEQISVLRENRALLSFFKLTMRPRRFFPEGTLAAHLFGYVGEVTDDEISNSHGLERGDIIGRTGIESVFERYLRGADGVRIVGISVEGTQVGEITGLMDGDEIERLGGAKASVPGCDIHLTIDLGLQRAAEEALQWERGALVAMDPRTGEILAMVSRPTYDPNMFIGGVGAERWRELFDDPSRPMFNRTVQAAYPPGSVFKSVTAYAALTHGRVGEHARLQPCFGAYRFGNRLFRCWQSRGHGALDAYGAIVQSCDTYFYQLGEKLEVDELASAARLFGLGRKTGIELPSEVSGIVPDRAYLDRRFGKRGWTKGLMLNFSIGQGEILTTPVQLCALTARIANGGKPVQPHVVREIVDPDGEVVYRFDAKIDAPAVDGRAISIVRDALRGVVADERGTGRAAAIPGVAVSGKTGTAQNPHGEDHALFIAYAPAEEPTLCIAVVMENAGHGGSMAAPIAKKVLAAYFAPPEGPPVPASLARGGGR